VLVHAQQNPQREALLRELSRGAPVRIGRVVVDTPTLADNGHSVPLRIAVDSPMTAADHVRRITILAERNPRPVVASYSLGPHSGRAEIATRIRVADIQDVIAVAEFSDGSFWMGSAHVIVTELACLEG
jgi:sulfur-oxidizing protein SoxY